MTSKKHPEYEATCVVLSISPKEGKDHYALKVKAQEWEEPRWITGWGTMPAVEIGDRIHTTIRETHKDDKVFYNIRGDIEILGKEEPTPEDTQEAPQPAQQPPAINLIGLRMHAQAITWGALRLTKPPSKKERDEIHRAAAEIVRYALTGATRDAEGEDE